MFCYCLVPLSNLWFFNQPQCIFYLSPRAGSAGKPGNPRKPSVARKPKPRSRAWWRPTRSTAGFLLPYPTAEQLAVFASSPLPFSTQLSPVSHLRTFFCLKLQKKKKKMRYHLTLYVDDSSFGYICHSSLRCHGPLARRDITFLNDEWILLTRRNERSPGDRPPQTSRWRSLDTSLCFAVCSCQSLPSLALPLLLLLLLCFLSFLF